MYKLNSNHPQFAEVYASLVKLGVDPASIQVVSDVAEYPAENEGPTYRHGPYGRSRRPLTGNGKVGGKRFINFPTLPDYRRTPGKYRIDFDRMRTAHDAVWAAESQEIAA